MKDNLPEIKVKGYKDEKKGGFGGLFGGAGASGGVATTGLGALIAGNIGTIAAVVIAAGIGISVVADKMPKNAPGKDQAQLGAVAPGKKANTQTMEYETAIQRAEKANSASSLAMFTDKNKGLGLTVDDGSAPKNAAKQEEAKTDEAKDGSADAPEGQAPDAQGIADGMMAGAGGQQGGLTGSSLSTGLGGGSGKSISLGKGGMGNNQFSMAGNVGSGFKAMPRFNERKGKLLGMRGASRPVTASASSGRGSKFSGGGKSWKQARGLWGTQKKAATATTADGARSTMDKAWEGSTGAGGAEGEGMEEEGIVTSPSLDNPGGSQGNGNIPSGDYNFDDGCSGCDYKALGAEGYQKCVAQAAKDGKCGEKQPDWTELATATNILILASCALAAIGGALVNVKVPPWVAIVGYVICAIAIALAAAALVCALILGFKYKQAGMAAVYGIGAALAGTAAVASLGGNFASAITVPASVLSMGAMLCSSIAGSLGSN